MNCLRHPAPGVAGIEKNAHREHGDAATFREFEATPVSMEGGLSQASTAPRDRAMRWDLRDIGSVITSTFLSVCRMHLHRD